MLVLVLMLQVVVWGLRAAAGRRCCLLHHYVYGSCMQRTFTWSAMHGQAESVRHGRGTRKRECAAEAAHAPLAVAGAACTVALLGRLHCRLRRQARMAVACMAQPHALAGPWPGQARGACWPTSLPPARSPFEVPVCQSRAGASTPSPSARHGAPKAALHAGRRPRLSAGRALRPLRLVRLPFGRTGPHDQASDP